MVIRWKTIHYGGEVEAVRKLFCVLHSNVTILKCQPASVIVSFR